jgi:serine/threonine-protein kinase
MSFFPHLLTPLPELLQWNGEFFDPPSLLPQRALPVPVHRSHDIPERWIWPFELLEKIGDGGMGEVYRARFVKNDRIVAVKLLPADVTDATLLARFEREMEVLRSLRHPNIVHSFGGVCEGDRQFYAMEYVEGGTLRELLRTQGRLSADRTIELAVQMCSALAYAHASGVIHRDVKPGNFLLTADGKLKLSDFGLATLVSGRKITAHDRTVGTFRYMAPEQISGKPPVSAQTDLYALGCVLLEMLTGSPPFRGETAGEVLQKHLREPPPRASSLAMTCPAELDNLIDRLLEKKPEDRPESAAAVALELRGFANTITIRQRPPFAQSPPARAEQVVSTGSSQPKAILQWLLFGCVAALLGVLVWNRSLARQVDAFKHAEQLWIEDFHANDTPTRMAAAKALGRMAPESSRAVAALMEGLNDDDPQIRWAAVEALGEAAAAGRPALRKLAKIQQTDDRPFVRAAAANSQKKIRAAQLQISVWPWLAGLVLILAVGGVMLFRRKFLASVAKDKM